MALDLHEIFEKYNDDFLKFDKITTKLSNRPDIHAFVLLDSIVPGKSDMVSAAEHDEIFLEVDASDLADAATEEQVVDLIRCGVRYSSEFNCLAMFV
jgi:hypothetical protein